LSWLCRWIQDGQEEPCQQVIKIYILTDDAEKSNMQLRDEPPNAVNTPDSKVDPADEMFLHATDDCETPNHDAAPRAVTSLMTCA